jgi:hypothetical protein
LLKVEQVLVLQMEERLLQLAELPHFTVLVVEEVEQV